MQLFWVLQLDPIPDLKKPIILKQVDSGLWYFIAPVSQTQVVSLAKNGSVGVVAHDQSFVGRWNKFVFLLQEQ